MINASQMWRAMSTTMKFMDIKENMGRIEKDKVGMWLTVRMRSSSIKTSYLRVVVL